MKKYSIRECKRILKSYYDKESRLYDEREFIDENDSGKVETLKNEIEKLICEKDTFIENIYALVVYEKYCEKKPILIKLKTNEEIAWDDAFGNSFNEINKGLRHSLVGLVEDDHGRYVFKK